ncbi:hypothetical protein KIN20_030172 [Parelaphostrongylus tenuis]|uniref:Uncharacterized protein n=1 Tax=Parelaphostrongylus tenuis TaxID=148309 RepID=A0AAD5R3B9_PARTN|nr:hypothetical protein KIN20_030172 [Parelaphostrongylus tenuis]
MNLNHLGPDLPEMVLRNPIVFSMWRWHIITKPGWPSSNIFNGNSDLRSFANMINANATAVGCYSAYCGATATSASYFSERYITPKSELLENFIENSTLHELI